MVRYFQSPNNEDATRRTWAGRPSQKMQKNKFIFHELHVLEAWGLLLGDALVNSFFTTGRYCFFLLLCCKTLRTSILLYRQSRLDTLGGPGPAGLTGSYLGTPKLSKSRRGIRDIQSHHA